MRRLFLISLLPVFLILSCSDDSTSPQEEPITPEWRNFVIHYVDYDSLQIESKDTLKVENQSIERVVLSYKDGSVYVPQDSVEPAYVPDGDKFFLNYAFSKKIDHSVISLNFRINYILNDGSEVKIDTTALMLKYPYKNANVFVTVNNLGLSYNVYFEDIDLNAKNLFFHPSGPMGIYEYNILAQTTTELHNYSSGNSIAHDSDYVFYETAAYSIYRFNLDADSVDLKFDLSSIDYDWIQGLECYNGHLYGIFQKGSTSSLVQFDYSGNIVSTKPYVSDSYFLTIYNDIAYSITKENDKWVLGRYDLNSETSLESRQLPTKISEMEGIRIYEDYFYFADWGRQVVGYIPLSDIQ